MIYIYKYIYIYDIYKYIQCFTVNDSLIRDQGVVESESCIYSLSFYC